MLRRMAKPATKGLSIAYIVLGILFAALMFFSASFKLSATPDAIKVLHDVIGLPLSVFPLLAACEIAGGLGLIAGIWRPKLGVAAGVGLVLYFVGAFVAHAIVADWAGMTAPILPFVLSCGVLALRILSVRQSATAASAAA